MDPTHGLRTCLLRPATHKLSIKYVPTYCVNISSDIEEDCIISEVHHRIPSSTQLGIHIVEKMKCKVRNLLQLKYDR